MSMDSMLALVFIGALCGMGVSMLVHYHETNGVKIIAAIVCGIVGAYAGATTLGKNFFITSVNGFADSLLRIIKSLSQILVSGIVLLPAFMCAVLFALAISLLMKVFMHNPHSK